MPAKPFVEFVIYRDSFRGPNTWGKIHCPDPAKTVFETLEDCARPWGVKDKGNTAIPMTSGNDYYVMDTNFSTRFKRDMIIIYNQPDLSIDYQGVKFSGVRIHGANTTLDLEGCIGVAKNRTPQGIQGASWETIFDMVKDYKSKGVECRLKIINLKQEA